MARPHESRHTYESYRNSCTRPTLSFMRRCERLARREYLLDRPIIMTDLLQVGSIYTAPGYPLTHAVAEHGSQRKAALALGLNLSTFQRRLKKEQDACAA